MNWIKNPLHFPSQETPFLIEGPSGNLELVTLAAPQQKGVAVLCHPHPLQGGTLYNKVVHTLSRAFHRKGLHVVRFNYRGVGKSEGQFGDSEGEITDLKAVIQWTQSVLGEGPLWLGGFSFGAYIAARGAQAYPCQQLYSIAPSVLHQPYAALGSVACPWVVIQGEEDEVVAPQAVYAWFEQQAKQSEMTLLTLPGASHFFHGQLMALRALVEDTLIGIS